MPALVVEPITVDQLTTTKVGGTGVFDKLMTTVTAHLDSEYTGQRLKGQDYAQVYLGSLTAILSNSVSFLLQKDEAAGRVAQINAQVALTEAQTQLVQLEIAREQLTRDLIAAQKDKVLAEIISIGINDLLTKEQTKKVIQDTANAVLEGDNLIAQNCLLKAQFDLTMVQKLQTTAQTSLIQQKIATEKAQVTEVGVDDNSVVGRQKLLYKAQTDGFGRDAEQKLLKILVDTWNVRRTTDDGTIADAVNQLQDATIGRAVNKAMTGVGA